MYRKEPILFVLNELAYHFSHPFLGTYEVVQFLELGNLKGTHPTVVYELHTTQTGQVFDEISKMLDTESGQVCERIDRLDT